MVGIADAGFDSMVHCTYNVRMKLHSKITTSGNSKAVRLPKVLLALTSIENEITLSVKDNAIIIQPAKSASPRAGWAEQIAADIKVNGPYPVTTEDEWGGLCPDDFDEADLGTLAENEDWGAWR